MAILYTLHPETPQQRTLQEIKEALQDGAVMLYPTDTVYAIGCDLSVKSGIERVRRIKQLSNDKPLTFLCSSLSNVASYATVSDVAYRIMKRLIPGPYTFLLPATKEVPRLVMSPKRRTTGIRVPDNPICLGLLEALENPIISTSAHLVGDEEMSASPSAPEYTSTQELFDRLDKLVDIIIDDGLPVQSDVSTVLDLTSMEPKVVREGLGWEAASDWVSDAG
ncbi:L-threonylcarbamoyladenylate synthase [Roseofilum sp. BLCC_M91]|uniref:L-threonylcarbamoyladenylate synthase n=1 Tax=Roseofilum halophilum BLCC-M91 TaxID=3022259 RepID=A0ABT7BHC3_9CYAN|nr:L-threonylcarbamoyladenylate synthase [Roseofilum halophilum]MDJ1178593.1 L-threonylcarbamoyladenylate synthase [Roseofilum halophilum BLCC-M91]